MMPQHDRYQTGHQSMVRQLNLSVIMQYLRESHSASRAGLAEMTGLNKTTVSSLVRELIEGNFVYETGYSPPGAGRPAVLLRINPSAGFIISAEVGPGFINVVRANFAAQVIWRHQETFEAGTGQKAVLRRLLARLHSAAAAPASAGTLLGLAIGLPGLVDHNAGELLFAPNLAWESLAIRDLFARAFPAPVFIDNDANLGALGEHYFGAAQGCDEVVYINTGRGLGAGFIHRGELFLGANGLAGEIGHMTADPSGRQCGCGNQGCWETQVSEAALFGHVAEAIANGCSSRLPEIVGPDLAGLTVPVIVAAADAGDAAANIALERVGRDLGTGTASLVNALNPGVVVLGGSLTLAGHILMPTITAELGRRALRWNRAAVRVVLARHGPDACIMGGVARALQFVLAKLGTTVKSGPPAVQSAEARKEVKLAPA